MSEYEIKVCMPELAKFCTSNGYLTPFVLEAPSLHYIDLDHFAPFGALVQRARAILEGVPGLACLKLSDTVVQALVHERGLVLHTFDRLKRFENATKLERVFVYLEKLPGWEHMKIGRLLPTLLPQSSACVNVFEQARPCSFDQENSSQLDNW